MKRGKINFKTWLIIIIILLSTIQIYSQNKFNIGDKVQANSTVHVRSTAGGTDLGYHYLGDQGTVTGGPTYASYNGTYYYWYQVSWSTSPTSGWSVQDGLDKITSTAPTITSVSPNLATGSNNSQPVNIYGSGFQSSGMNVTLKDVTHSLTYSNRPYTYVNSNQITLNPTFSNDPATWTVQITNTSGQSSSAYSFSVVAPFPIITSINPSSTTAGGSGFTLTVNGNTFNMSSVVYWNGSSRPTTPVTTSGLTTSLQAAISSSDIATSGTAQVKVYTPTPGGGTSSAVNFTINPVVNPAPTITSVSPNPATGSNSSQLMNVYGSGFQPTGMNVTLKDLTHNLTYSNRPYTYVSSSQITLNPILSNDPATWTVQITNTGGQSSSVYSFSVVAPLPVITSINPSSTTAGGTGFTLTVNGSTFNTSSVVYWNGSSRTTTPVITNGLTTSLQAAISSSDIATSGTALVTVYMPTPGGGTSSAVNFTVNPAANPAPTITSVSPNPATGSNGSQPVNVYGSGFQSSGMNVTLKDVTHGLTYTNRPYSYISSSQITLNPTFSNDPATWTVQVTNTSGQSSSAYSFSVAAPFPVITSINPTSATAGGNGFTLTVNGNTFNMSSVIYWNGSSRPTTPITSGGLTTSLQAVISSSDISTSGTAQVKIYTPTPGGGTSSAVNFIINPSSDIVPVINSISPTTIYASVYNQSFKVYGKNFQTSSHLIFTDPNNQTYNSSLHPDREGPITSTEFDYQFNNGGLTGTWSVKIINPNGLTSNSVQFQVSPSSNTPFGTLLGSFNGVSAYSNGKVDSVSNIFNTAAGVNTGMKWQCVEYVNRYYYLKYGLDLKSTPIYGNADHYYPNATSAGLMQYPNGSSIAPQVGDILCFTGGSAGHVAIIRAVGTSEVTVIQQNVKENSNDTAYTYPLSISNGNYSIDGSKLGTSYSCQGWLRRPSLTSAPSISSISLSSYPASSNNQTMTINGSNYQSGATLTFTDPQNDQIPSTSSKLIFVSSSQLSYQFNNGNDAGIWNVKVNNPDGQSSNKLNFEVLPDTNHNYNVVLGIDVSNYQNNAGVITWSNVFNSGIRFVFVKASESYDIVDKSLDNNVNGAKSANLMVGVYHLIRPDYPLYPNDYTQSAISEAQLFLSKAGNYIGNGFIPPVIDVDSQFGLSGTQLSSYVRTFIQYIVQQKMINTPIIYTTRSILLNLDSDLVSNYSLWIATDDGDTHNTPTLNGISWSQWKFKQYRYGDSGGSLPGAITGAVDLDSFNGDSTSLSLLLIVPNSSCYTLQTNISPAQSGTITINTSQNCSGGFSPNTQISLTATPSIGYIFSNWSGTGGTFSSTSSTSCSFTITGNANITATFVPNPVTISSPNWYYTNTGISHVILIPLSSNPNINNVPLSNGDYIGVFYDSSGTLACGGYTPWNATSNVSVTAWGNDQNASHSDGFATGETFKWKIWRASDQKTFDAAAVYSTDPSFTSSDKFTANGLSGLTKLTAVLSTQQQISLSAGWQLISSYIQPVNSNLDSMFQQVKTDLIIMKDGSGNVYWPTYGVNSIVNWQSTLGYQIKMQNNRTLNIIGNQITPETTNISIPQGWSMVGYLRSAPMAIDTALKSINDKIIIVKNGKGQVYWPAYGINSIGNMNPGEGYQIKLTAAANLLYPANYGPVSPPAKAAINNISMNNTFFAKPVITDNSAVILFQNKILNNILQPGDEIGVFNNEGLLCGSGIYEGRNLAITIFGDDNSTKEKNGFLPGEKFEVRIYSKKHGKEFNSVKVTWLNDDGSYKVNGINIVNTLSINKYKFNGNAELEVLTNYPNPFNPTTTVVYNLNKSQIIKISLYNILGQLVRIIINEVQTEGEHQLEINGNNLASGIYAVVFQTADLFKTIKINLIK